MAKREQMLQQLKRANKRRSRRPVPAVAAKQQGPSPQTVLVGQLAEAVSGYADRNPSLVDKQIVVALNAILRGRECSDANSIAIRQQLVQCRPPEMKDQAWKSGIEAFLKDVQQVERGSEDSRSFISFLEVMSS